MYFKYFLDFYWGYYLFKNENRNNVSSKLDTPNKKNKKNKKMGNQQGNQQMWNYVIPESCVYRKQCNKKYKQEHNFGDKSECLHRTLKHPNMNVKEMFIMSNKYTNENQIKYKIKRLRKRISKLEKQL